MEQSIITAKLTVVHLVKTFLKDTIRVDLQNKRSSLKAVVSKVTLGDRSDSSDRCVHCVQKPAEVR
jgi:hypothetical protein